MEEIQPASYTMAPSAGLGEPGRRMLNAAPDSPFSRGTTSIVPLYRSTISLVSHKPSPVPISFFVVMNGSNR